MALSALFLAATGVHDTDIAKWPQRIGYWGMMASLVAVLLAPANAQMARRWGAAPPAIRGATAAALLWLPLTALAMILCVLMFGGFPSPTRFGALLLPIGSVVAALQLLLLAAPHPRLSAAPPADKAAADHPPFRASLPLPLRDAQLLALEAEDHYVRIHTARGSALLRMRFRDAVAMMEGAGVRTHRSWWVRLDAVSEIRRRRKGAVVTLVDGRQVPVSSASARTLLGWRPSHHSHSIVPGGFDV